MRVLLAALFALAAMPSLAQAPAAADSAAYRVYTGAGTPTDLAALVAAFAEADVVFLGEQHNDPVAHALQLDLLRAATEQGADAGRPVALSLEMVERDAQLVLDEYLAGLVRERDFLAASRPWQNYASDYRPLVEHARAHGQAVVAANAPARYVRLVSRAGVGALARLPAAARAYLPLPVVPASDALAAKFEALMGGMAGHGDAPASGTMDEQDGASGAPGSEGGAASARDAAMPSPDGMPALDLMLAAQNLRDAAMADALAQHLAADPGALVLHVTGAFHSEGGLGIPEHLARLRPDARALVVTMRPAADVAAFDAETHASLGDFVVLTDASRPRTYEAGF